MRKNILFAICSAVLLYAGGCFGMLLRTPEDSGSVEYCREKASNSVGMNTVNGILTLALYHRDKHKGLTKKEVAEILYCNYETEEIRDGIDYVVHKLVYQHKFTEIELAMVSFTCNNYLKTAKICIDRAGIMTIATTAAFLVRKVLSDDNALRPGDFATSMRVALATLLESELAMLKEFGWTLIFRKDDLDGIENLLKGRPASKNFGAFYARAKVTFGLD
jgi:hypothetical protein